MKRERKFRISITLKIIFPFLLTVISVAITFYGFILPGIAEILFEQKKEKVMDLCKNTIQLAEQYYERYQNGEFSESEAQNRFKERVRAMRYGEDLKEYFWITDLNYVMIMHPYMPEIEGLSMENFKDPDGTRVFFNISEIAREKGYGFIDYIWQLKDNEAIIENKVSYVQLFEPWNWIIGTGVYYSDIKNNTMRVTNKINLVLTLILIFIGLISVYIIAKEIKNEENRIKRAREKELLIIQLKNTNEELHKAKKEAEDANKTKDMFLANVSHDLRTPLNGIIGFSKLLEESDKDNREGLFTEYVDYIQQSGNYLLKMINEILDFSKIHAKKLFLEKSEFSLNETISYVIRSLSFFAKEKGINVRFNGQKIFYIKADEIRMKKVFYNLLSNAIKYTTDGKDVHINLYEEDDEILIRFKDNGIGLSAEDTERIFKPFEQANKIKAEGTGLGLVIAKEIAELHKGSIKLESVEGKGSEFTVHLPITLIVNPIKKEETDIFEDSVFKNKKIMVVEDDKISRKFMMLYLQKHNMIPIELSTGKEVLERLKSDKFDLILMDIQLPDTVGTELIKKVKAITNTDIPIIALTAHSSSKKRKEILASGFDALCSKPIDSSLLLKTMYQFLRKHL